MVFGYADWSLDRWSLTGVTGGLHGAVEAEGGGFCVGRDEGSVIKRVVTRCLWADSHVRL